MAPMARYLEEGEEEEEEEEQQLQHRGARRGGSEARGPTERSADHGGGAAAGRRRDGAAAHGPVRPLPLLPAEGSFVIRAIIVKTWMDKLAFCICSYWRVLYGTRTL